METTKSAAAGAGRPATLDELRAALDAFPGLDPVERARRAPDLIEAAKSVLADERGRAMAEANAAGLGPTALARALGITRAKVYEAMARVGAGGGRAETGPPPFQAEVYVPNAVAGAIVEHLVAAGHTGREAVQGRDGVHLGLPDRAAAEAMRQRLVAAGYRPWEVTEP